ncbi:hypothetical protein ACLCDV_21180 [Sphingobacterium sp. Lzh-3]|uniref:hypothetical protein n=1 Tax=Sphingobacterium sp. Lzh-3 TaxID=3382150 RepID=UPI00398D0063
MMKRSLKANDYYFKEILAFLILLTKGTFLEASLIDVLKSFGMSNIDLIAVFVL